MSQLRIEKRNMLAGNLGPENPLPPLRLPVRKASRPKVDESVPQEARRYLGYGLETRVLPYSLQDAYDRDRRPRDFLVAVLENEILQATFLLEHGGRLWSLVHRPSGRELLYRNPVFQPANLAVRNAWFSGGVEWNVGVRGHTPLTCSPVFAARVKGDDGSPILRLYEWERIRGVPYQLDFSLPPGSPWLFVRVRLTNPHGHEIPNYWWSNIAVPESPDVRVLVPADHAFNHAYRGGVRRVAVPYVSGVDVSYPTNNPGATDFFFDIPDDRRRWIAALDGQGRGLIQTSTLRQRGRKLFVWGMSHGGRRWQDFLSIPGHPYIEIQAGVARTQWESFPMQPGEEIAWMEAYGLMEADAELVHSADWHLAQQEVEGRLQAMLPEAWLEEELRRTRADAQKPPQEVVHYGSGWGALERRRRERAGKAPFASTALVFDDASLGKDQSPWLALLEKGELPVQHPAELCGGWMVQVEWRELLEEAIRQGRSDHWLSWLHLGVMRYHGGEVEPARQAWQESMRRQPSAWALRNLAVLAVHEDDRVAAAELWLQAYREAPELSWLVVECAKGLLDAGRYEDVEGLVARVPESIAAHGRLRIYRAQAAFETGDFEKAEGLLRSDIELSDLREGEVVLSDLWYAIQEQRVAGAEGIAVDENLRRRVRRESPLPPHLDFRMSSQKKG
ncbi:MAG: DUF5107 domain-containing protein [Limnochordia bacterium]|jgi:hypothetical protein